MQLLLETAGDDEVGIIWDLLQGADIGCILLHSLLRN